MASQSYSESPQSCKAYHLMFVVSTGNICKLEEAGESLIQTTKAWFSFKNTGILMDVYFLSEYWLVPLLGSYSNAVI